MLFERAALEPGIAGLELEDAPGPLPRPPIPLPSRSYLVYHGIKHENIPPLSDSFYHTTPAHHSVHHALRNRSALMRSL